MDVLCHQLAQLLLSVLVLPLFLAFLKWRLDDIVAVLVLGLGRRWRQRSVLRPRSCDGPLKDLAHCGVEDLPSFRQSGRLLNNTGILGPGHRSTAILVGTSLVQSFIQGLEEGIVMHILYFFCFLLASRQIYTLSVFGQPLHREVLTIDFIEKGLSQNLLVLWLFCDQWRLLIVISLDLSQDLQRVLLNGCVK